MTYTQIAFIAVLLAAFIDLAVLKTKLLKRKVFWTSYAIILLFQLLTNWWLTSRNIVMYSEDAILEFVLHLHQWKTYFLALR